MRSSSSFSSPLLLLVVLLLVITVSSSPFSSLAQESDNTNTTEISVSTDVTASGNETNTTIAVVNPTIPLITEKTFSVTFPTTTESIAFPTRFNEFYADKATSGVIVYQVTLNIMENKTTPFDTINIVFSIDENERDAELASRAATYFALLSGSDLFSLFSITSSCVERVDGQSYNTSTIGNQDLCDVASPGLAEVGKDAAAAVVLIILFVLGVCVCIYCYKRMSADKEGEEGQGGNNNNGDDNVDESHLPPGMRRRAREAMQNAHLQSQHQQQGGGDSRSAAYTGIVMDLPMDETAGNNANAGEEMMTPREGGDSQHRNFTGVVHQNTTSDNIATVYDDILNQDQFGGASAIDNRNNRRW